SRTERLAVSRPSDRLGPAGLMQQVLPEELFLGMLCLERKKAERSQKKLLLVLIDATAAFQSLRYREVRGGLVRAVDAARRETDIAGWYQQDGILGTIFTEMGEVDSATVQTVVSKVRDALNSELSSEDLKRVHLSVHVFGGDEKNPDLPPNTAFYPDLDVKGSKRIPLLVKRCLDVILSVAALVFCLPLFLVIAIAVKLGSRGPVFFQQERLGQFRKPFNCLKFRSMYAENDPRIHREFMKDLIAGSYKGKSEEGTGRPIYKMKNDPRITRIGRFLRRTSLDELPQFINVLLGDMSLVGPRPPLAYEYEQYDTWHRRRVLEVKPGITGLWQVKGRSRVPFDDMVRLDIQYARQWSVWLDVTILLRTPRAVFMGDGAY
ncbi:MAG TPA: exopolysaccharide biosynthesis polyprenyl glycosylphosphotransferase, partial [Candidatus Acidoferrales bacterium]|nr:exopolysaccharide biosynthesis polyprenyl glycosylphosphotransferase [Candidatus Acidoferrales bacterium]